MIIEITNLTEAQKIAIEDMMHTWTALGNLGASRWTAFFADGDGDFRPKITIDGENPKSTNIISNDSKWQGDEYRMDYDAIAWKLII